MGCISYLIQKILRNKNGLPSRNPLTTFDVSKFIFPVVERNSASGENMDPAEPSRLTRNNLKIKKKIFKKIVYSSKPKN